MLYRSLKLCIICSNTVFDFFLFFSLFLCCIFYFFNQVPIATSCLHLALAFYTRVCPSFHNCTTADILSTKSSISTNQSVSSQEYPIYFDQISQFDFKVSQYLLVWQFAVPLGGIVFCQVISPIFLRASVILYSPRKWWDYVLAACLVHCQSPR